VKASAAEAGGDAQPPPGLGPAGAPPQKRKKKKKKKKRGEEGGYERPGMRFAAPVELFVAKHGRGPRAAHKKAPTTPAIPAAVAPPPRGKKKKKKGPQTANPPPIEKKERGRTAPGPPCLQSAFLPSPLVVRKATTLFSPSRFEP